MWYVHILKNTQHDWRYIGSTNDLKERFKSHNLGENQAAKHYLPFKLEA
jgi:predicted GIY-YIG superfamily endonuclease